MTDEQLPTIGVRVVHNGKPVEESEFAARSGDTYTVHHTVNVDDADGRRVLRRQFEVRLEFFVPLRETGRLRVIHGEKGDAEPPLDQEDPG